MEYFFNLEHIHKIHFIGIGGISMSALAKLCHNNGMIVSGSDRVSSEITDELKNIGIKIYIGHDKNNIHNIDAVCYTIAVGKNNVELVEAQRKNIVIFERADLLEQISYNYKHVIAVSGTHGKTTTCGMIASIFISANKNPTIHIGGDCETVGGNLRIGGKEFFITEACEFKKHLLKIPHEVGVVLNIEADHPDSYADINDLHDTFDRFCGMSSEVNIVGENYVSLLKNRCKYNVKTFSKGIGGNYFAKNIRQFKSGKITFDCYKNGEFFSKFCLNEFGKHNVFNALASIAVADYYNISKFAMFEGLKNFSGVKRRFRFVGKINNSIVIEDYAHHPTEIKAVIDCAREVFDKKIVVVFQPHTYSRTKSLFGEFLKCFDGANQIYILPTYSAREKPIKNASGKFLAKALMFKQKNCKYVASFGAMKKILKTMQNDVILLVGAGDIESLCKAIKKDYLKKIK